MSEKQEKGWIKMYEVNQQYQIIDKVGRGTYGTVYKAKNLKTGKNVAIKKLQNNDVKLQTQGFPITALREISLLKQMSHQNIIELNEIILSKPSKRNLFRGSTFLVFQYMDHDLAGLFKNKTKFTLSEIKCIIKQLLKGVAYLHSKNIFHRDIKSANILLNDKGQIKLADFGLGRQVKLDGVYTFKVVTLWYRAPELLLGCKQYDSKIDIWSIGCVLAQFLIGQILFKRDSDFTQIERIYQICGGIEENCVPEEIIKTFTYYNDLKPKKSYKNNLVEHLLKLSPSLDEVTLSFLQSVLSINPKTRLSAEQALKHPFFTSKPYPCKHSEIQKIDYECHEMFRDKTIIIKRSPSYDHHSVNARKHQYKREDYPYRRQRKNDRQRKSYSKEKGSVQSSNGSRHDRDDQYKKKQHHKHYAKRHGKKDDRSSSFEDKRRSYDQKRERSPPHRQRKERSPQRKKEKRYDDRRDSPRRYDGKYERKSRYDEKRDRRSSREKDYYDKKGQKRKDDRYQQKRDRSSRERKFTARWKKQTHY